MTSEQKTIRRGRKPGTSGPRSTKYKLSVRVPGELKAKLDEARASGVTQAERAAQLIQLGLLLEECGRFLLPPEQQELAVALLSAYECGPAAMARLWCEKSAETVEERRLRYALWVSGSQRYALN